jgi:hypothetical protein
MADYCVAGQFDGYVLTTPRDRQLCVDGGGRIEQRGGGTSGGCAGSSAASYSSQRGEPVDVGSLYDARTLYAQARETAALRNLSEAAAPVVDRILAEDAALTEEVVAGLRRLAELAAKLTGTDTEHPVYGTADHEYFATLARRVAEHDESRVLSDLVEEAITLAEPLRDLPAAAVRDRLGPVPDFSQLPQDDVELKFLLPTQDFYDTKIPWLRHSEPSTTLDGWDRTSVAEILKELREAEAIIGLKAASLGSLTYEPQGDITPVEGGYMRRFKGCDIYLSREPGAHPHEIHGDIRRKYLQVNGPNLLGMPTTDETSCPDGQGRYNHFSKNASIYWNPTTGPFYVRGVVRFRWASTGWEAGPLGYPVQDEDSMGGLYPGDHPDMHWSHFQNGIVFGQGSDAQSALAATASVEQIRTAVSAALQRRMPIVELTVWPVSLFTIRPGLSGVDLNGVDDWSYGFDGAGRRTLRLHVRGYVSVPVPGVTDPTFSVDLSLQFSTMWQVTNFQFPPTKAVVATLVGDPAIRASGVMSDAIVDAIRGAVQAAFTPSPTNPEVRGPSMLLATVPTGANQRGEGNLDFLDVMLMSDGSLNVYVNPLPSLVGALRRVGAQSALDDALTSL